MLYLKKMLQSMRIIGLLKFNFELAFNNLPLSKLFKAYLSVTLA